MQLDAKALDDARRRRTNFTEVENKSDSRKSATFIKGMHKEAYMESEMALGDRLNRNQHYRERNSHRD